MWDAAPKPVMGRTKVNFRENFLEAKENLA